MLSSEAAMAEVSRHCCLSALGAVAVSQNVWLTFCVHVDSYKYYLNINLMC